MLWTLTTFGLTGLGGIFTAISMALWIRKLRPLKNFLTNSHIFRHKPWVRSDTGFLIFSEMMADVSVKIFIAAGIVAGGAAFFAPFHMHLDSLMIVLTGVFFRSIAVSAWCHIQSTVIHRAPEDDGSGVFGMAEIDWQTRRNSNASVALIMVVALLLISLES